MTDAELRELDAQIAVEVMGWKPWRSPAAKTADPDCWLTGNTESPTHAMWGWKPSVDMSDAWRAVEKLIADWSGRLRVTVETSGKGATCDIVALTGHGRQGRADSDSAPLAICLAAIRASGSEASTEGTT